MGLFSNTETEKKLQEALEEIKILKAMLEKYNKPNARGAGRKGKITEEDKKQIYMLREQGISYNKIAKELQLPVGTVFNYAKTLHIDEDQVAERIKKITDAVESNQLKQPEPVNVDQFIEKNKYRQWMNQINKNQK